ncbi:hypothetical protein CR983_04360 [Candidatus Saccharibacteria bacterium]|nr:MAG: hypothetical protein CR983_04360 [Candidatus Saccharibacteria bacterium]
MNMFDDRVTPAQAVAMQVVKSCESPDRRIAADALSDGVFVRVLDGARSPAIPETEKPTPLTAAHKEAYTQTINCVQLGIQAANGIALGGKPSSDGSRAANAPGVMIPYIPYSPTEQ